MLDRLWLSVTLAATTSAGQLACDVSEAAPSLPLPVWRDAGPTDAALADAPMLDASIDALLPADAGFDALPPLIDGGVRRRHPRPRRDAGVIVDASPPPIDAGAPPIDAGAAPADAAVMDAALLSDAAILDAGPPDARDILYDSGEAPPLYDASLFRGQAFEP